MTRPNILYIHSHDTGIYISPYGWKVHTPNLERFSRKAIFFRNCFCAGPTCSPSRAALLTGMYPHICGMTGLAHRGWYLNDYSKHIVNILKANGYYTVLSGIQHEASPNSRGWELIGYDEFISDDIYNPHAKAVEFLKNVPSEPFFLSIGFFDTHRKFPKVDSGIDCNFITVPGYLPDCEITRQDFAGFITSVQNLDIKIGEILDVLDKTDLAKRSIVILTTDHGIAFPRMKCNLTDGGIKVMLMIKGPSEFSKPMVINSLVSQIDVFPTILDFIGIEIPSWMCGKSILPLINGTSSNIRDEIFSEVNYHASYEPMRCVRTIRYKYIRRFSNRKKPILSNCDDGPTKTLFIESGWPDMELPEEELYDLIFDPYETNNLAYKKEYKKILKGMRDSLKRWMEETKDPLLSGFVPSPVGAMINHPDAISPKEQTLPADQLVHILLR